MRDALCGGGASEVAPFAISSLKNAIYRPAPSANLPVFEPFSADFSWTARLGAVEMAPKQRPKPAPVMAGRPVFDEPERIPGIPMKAPVPKFPKKATASARRPPTAAERKKTEDAAEARARAKLDAEVTSRLAQADAMKSALADAARSIRGVLAKGLAAREPRHGHAKTARAMDPSKENRMSLANAHAPDETPEERAAPLLAKFRRAQADRAEQDKIIAAMRRLLTRAGATKTMIDAAVDRELFPGVGNASDESVVAFGSSRELLMREVRRLRAREKAASGTVTAKTVGPKAPGGGGSFEARTQLARVAAALEDISNGRVPAPTSTSTASVPPSPSPRGVGTLASPGITNVVPSPIAIPPSPGSMSVSGVEGVALDALEQRLGRQLEHQARMIEATTRQFEAQHREEQARLEREARHRAEEVKRARRESEQLVAETAERVVDVARRSLPHTPVPTPRGRDIGAREEPGTSGGDGGDNTNNNNAVEVKMNQRMAEVIDELVDELRTGAEAASERNEKREQEHALVAKRLEEVTKSHSMNLKAAKADISRVTRDELAKLDKVHEERSRDLAATVIASEEVVSLRVDEGIERHTAEVKAAVEAAREQEEAARTDALAAVTKRVDDAAKDAAERAQKLERELAVATERLELEVVGARGETAKIRREFEETASTRAQVQVAAADASNAVREVMQLQKRLLAAQVDARLGWRETQRLHMARMENMAARLGEYTGREQQLSSELHECNVKLELERREHARLRGMHKEMWRETSAARAGRYEAELSASAAAEAATAARDAAVREISKSRDVALTEMARLRAHYESLLASNPKAASSKAESAVIVESLNAELAEARRQRTSVESDLHDALRRLRNSAADLVASRRTIVSLQTALERTNGGKTAETADAVDADVTTTNVEVPRVPRESGDATPREFDAPPVMFQTPQPTGPGVTFTSIGAPTPIRITDEDEVTESEDGEGSPEMRAMLRASAEARERLEALTRLRFDEVPLSPK